MRRFSSGCTGPFRIFALTSPLCVGARTRGTTGVMISRRCWCSRCGAKPQPRLHSSWYGNTLPAALETLAIAVHLQNMHMAEGTAYLLHGRCWGRVPSANPRWAAMAGQRLLRWIRRISCDRLVWPQTKPVETHIPLEHTYRHTRGHKPVGQLRLWGDNNIIGGRPTIS